MIFHYFVYVVIFAHHFKEAHPQIDFTPLHTIKSIKF